MRLHRPTSANHQIISNPVDITTDKPGFLVRNLYHNLLFQAFSRYVYKHCRVLQKQHNIFCWKSYRTSICRLEFVLFVVYSSLLFPHFATATQQYMLRKTTNHHSSEIFITNMSYLLNDPHILTR